MDKIQDKMTEVIEDSTTTKEQLEFFEKRLRENLIIAQSKTMKSLFFFIIVSIAWLVIKSALIKKVSIFGMEFEEFGLPVLIIPPIAAFFFYQLHCNFGISKIFEFSLKQIYSRKLQPFEKRDLNVLLTYPTIPNIEIIFGQILEVDTLLHKTTWAWCATMFIIMFLFLPVTLLLWMSCSLIASPVIGIQFSILSTGLVLILTARSLLVLYNAWILSV